jgi:hypothetical protein
MTPSRAPASTSICARGHWRRDSPTRANDGLFCPGPECVGNNIFGDFEVIVGSPANELIIGDTDAETITGGGGYDITKGLGGDDTIRNQEYRFAGMPNVLYGGAGDDLLYVTPGSPDTFHGGGGSDTLSFTILTAGVVVTLDDLPNDGTPGTDADVAGDIERIIGTTYADTITGNGGDNTFLAGPGPDTLFGLGGNDTLLGQGGNDNVERRCGYGYMRAGRWHRNDRRLRGVSLEGYRGSNTARGVEGH